MHDVDEQVSDKFSDACGVFAICAPGADVARITFFGLYALQHRGQESAGIAVSDGQTAAIHKGMGLVAQVFDEQNLAPLQGHLAIGHTRYSTTGGSFLRNAQPYLIETIHGPLGVAHNGNLTNARTLRRDMLERGVGLTSSSDSEVITQLLAAATPSGVGSPFGRLMPAGTWEDRISAFMQRAEGAYSLTILTRDAVFAVRDPWGLRPLCLGHLPLNGHGTGWVPASESCALATIGAEYVRDVEPGDIVRLDREGMKSTLGRQPEPRAFCIFELVYFARPDSTLDNQTVHQVRQQLGRELAREAPVPGADVVVGVPDSSTPAAIGYAQALGIPFSEGFTKNRYIGRTFIQPDDRLRKAGIALKYNPLPANLRGKRVVMVDDSIVRGNTAGPLVQLLRQGGAAEVHVRVSSPPVQHPCFMGIDMATTEQLIGASKTVSEIREIIGAGSLAYLSHDGMMAAIRAGQTPQAGFCSACFTGKYPVRLEEWWANRSSKKLAFEGALE